MGDKRGVYRVLVGKPEGKRPLGRPRHRWEDNINTPPTTHSNQFQLFHDSSRQQHSVTVTRCCRYSYFVLLKMGDGDVQNM
jgi:hypothetical protein